MKKLLGLTLVLLLTAGGDALLAQGKGKGQGPKNKVKTEKVKAEKVNVKKDKVKTDRDVVIDSDGHSRVIGDYYRREGLPPGLAKRSELPPGLRRQLLERGTLPPGLEKRWVAVPDSLGRRLPPIPANSRRYFLGRDLLIVDPDRNLLLRLIPNVLPG